MSLKYKKGLQKPVPFTAPHWDADEFVLLKPFRNGFVNLQAQFRASRPPEGLTKDELEEMSAQDYHKLSWRSDEFNIAVFEEMILHWELKDADGEWIPFDKNLIREVFEDEDVEAISGAIKALGQGPKEGKAVTDPDTGQAVPFPDATGTDSAG